jgi:hypothetical protein
LDPRQIVVAQYFSQILSPDALPGFEKSRLNESPPALSGAQFMRPASQISPFFDQRLRRLSVPDRLTKVHESGSVKVFGCPPLTCLATCTGGRRTKTSKGGTAGVRAERCRGQPAYGELSVAPEIDAPVWHCPSRLPQRPSARAVSDGTSLQFETQVNALNLRPVFGGCGSTWTGCLVCLGS